MIRASNKLLTSLALLAVFALCSAAGAVELQATGTNTATGTATVEGDIFTNAIVTSSLNQLELDSGVWAHAYALSNGAVNTADSERTVPARDESRTLDKTVVATATMNAYTLKTHYDASTVVAKVSTNGLTGSVEAFSEVSANASASEGGAASTPYLGAVGGDAQLISYVSNTASGTANASANGGATFSSAMKNGSIVATGSVSGSVALNSANSAGNGGNTTGAAIKVAAANASSLITGKETTTSESYEYLSLFSGRSGVDGLSSIEGNIAGAASSSGYYSMGVMGSTYNNAYGNSQSATSGDLTATADTYKLGDSITPGAITVKPNLTIRTQLDAEAGTAKTTLPTGKTLQSLFLTSKAPSASAYQMSQSTVRNDSTVGGAAQYSDARIETMTAQAVTRTQNDANEVFGASYIDNGAVSASGDTAATAGSTPVTLSTASLNGIFLGSGAHLLNRLTGTTPQSFADLSIYSRMKGSAYGFVNVTGAGIDSSTTPKTGAVLVRSVGPSFSATGTTADATGSYMAATNLDATAVHIATAGFTTASQLVADDISEINIYSWISGNDARTHAESIYGATPYASSPVYTSDPIGKIGQTNGPTPVAGATSTSRSVDVIFSSKINT